jgi:hypothetical protein
MRAHVWNEWRRWGRVFLLLAGGILLGDATYHGIVDSPLPWIKAMFEGFIGFLFLFAGITGFLLRWTKTAQQEKVSSDGVSSRSTRSD